MRRSVAVVASLGVALAACRQPTQIEVQVSTNVACGDWQGSALAVGQLGPDLENAIPSTTSMTCDDAGHVGTVVVIPAGADNANVAIKVVGAVGAAGVVSLDGCTADAGYTNCIVARRALRFIPHESLTLAMPLEQACDNDPCAPDETCVEGLCKSAVIPDPTQCENVTCGEGLLPAEDGGIDATVPEGGTLDGGGLDATLADGASGDAAGPPEGDAAASMDASVVGCGTGCALALGAGTTCVLAGGGVTCWGEDYIGELGNDTQTMTSLPGPVQTASGTLTGASGIVSGYDTSCAFLGGGAVSCWGGGVPLALPVTENLVVATPQPSLAGASAIAIANYHQCWQTGATLTCASYGPGETAPFGVDGGGSEDASVAVVSTLAPPAASAGPFRQLATTVNYTCVLDAAGNVYCMGDNDDNAVDPSPGSPDGVLSTFGAVPMPNGEPVLEMGMMSATACARTAGHVFCWGSEYVDARGGGDGVHEPNEVFYGDGGPIADAVQMAPGEFHQCVLRASGGVACWGDDEFLELGRGAAEEDAGFSPVAEPVVLADGGVFSGATFLASGGYHTCALATGGSLWCWGENEYGETAPGDTNARGTATPVTP